MYLADFGQISPTEYPHLLSSWQGRLGVLNFTKATSYPPTNNIFVNASLYEIALNTPTPLMNDTPSNYGVNSANINGDFPLKANHSAVLVQSYYCQQRELKHPINLFITVVAGDYALIVGGYTVVVLMAAVIEKRRKEGKHLASFMSLTRSKLL